MWKYYNPNPRGSNVGDCTIRAISKAQDASWDEIYTALAVHGFSMCDMPSANHVWGDYLKRKGYCRHIVEDMTVIDFCKAHPIGCYILAIQGHVVCVVDGDYYDSWDSGSEYPMYYWEKCL